MKPQVLSFISVVAAAVFAASMGYAQTLAPTPPMGWNSWDAYGLTIDETAFKDNATVLAGMEQLGWQYAVIDEGWYMENPLGKTVAEMKYDWNDNGLLIPSINRYPSAANGAGFKPLADWVHSQGLKFGIHIVRGIPRQVADANLAIGGSNFHTMDAADTTSPCPWDQGNWGVKDNAAGQAYYDSMFKLYAAWGLDFIKVDCISDRPYRITEIRQIAEAIRKTGRRIVLSLSPGPTALEHAAEVAKYAQLWRITDDHWDGWSFKHEANAGEYPFGLRDEFDRIAKWASYAKPGGWPDPDMLPEGWLGPHPGKDAERKSAYTQDEQRTEFTLWAVSRSPLILGANLTKLDEFTRSLITNKELLEINQHGMENHPVTNLPAGFENVRVWIGKEPGTNLPPYFVAFFNLDEKPVTAHLTWSQLGLGASKRVARSIWDGAKLAPSAGIDVTLAPHASNVYSVAD